MLAQSFLPAADLGITEPQRDALMKTLVLLETGKLRHVPEEELVNYARRPPAFAGLFNMAHVRFEHDCGTVGCIKGTAEMISGVSLDCLGPALHELFYTACMNGRDITPDQAATALRSYLSTGDAKWHEAISG